LKGEAAKLYSVSAADQCRILMWLQPAGYKNKQGCVSNAILSD
jgi:hypothetical protein